MYLELDEFCIEDLTAHAGGEYSLFGIAHAGGVGQQLHIVAVDVRQHFVGSLVHHVDALHGYGYHL